MEHQEDKGSKSNEASKRSSERSRDNSSRRPPKTPKSKRTRQRKSKVSKASTSSVKQTTSSEQIERKKRLAKSKASREGSKQSGGDAETKSVSKRTTSSKSVSPKSGSPFSKSPKKVQFCDPVVTHVKERSFRTKSSSRSKSPSDQSQRAGTSKMFPLSKLSRKVYSQKEKSSSSSKHSGDADSKSKISENSPKSDSTASVSLSSLSSIGESLFQDCVISGTCFFGYLSPVDAEDLLPKKGQFLVRCRKMVTEHSKRVWYITIRAENNQMQHHAIKQNSAGLYMLNNSTFGSMSALIEQLKKGKEQIGDKESKAVLISTVPRPKWLVHIQRIKLYTELGAGQAGQVWKGIISSGRFSTSTSVAVKCLNDKYNISEEKVESMYLEASILRCFDHPHIVKFIGIVVEKFPPWILTEICECSLKGFLLTNKRNIKTKDRVRFCYEAALGFDYIAKKGYVYRDIAARNCLVKENHIKITDFGLARKGPIYCTPEGVQEFLPLKTLPPESLINKKFSEKSDVWSFAQMVWEIFSDAPEPYADIIPTLNQATWGEELLLKIMHGYRLEIPKGVPRHIENMIKCCWDSDPSKRPTFSEIARTLGLKEHTPWYKNLGHLFK